MLDNRYETFLTLVKTKSYTQTAAKLFITQPAVTHQIKSLESELGLILVKYERPNLFITPIGIKLANYIEETKIQSTYLLNSLKKPQQQRNLKFGATQSFNQIVEPELIAHLTNHFANIECKVNNTSEILKRLVNGDIEFGLVEGNFDRLRYEYLNILKDNFILVCSAANPLKNQPHITLKDCLNQPLLLRESGSGTREILVNWLKTQNQDITSFKKIITIGNMITLIQLLKSNLGISFMYRSIAEKYLQSGLLVELNLDSFTLNHELSLVYLPNSFYKDEYLEIGQFLIRYLNK